jgi:hypothetical protein
MTLAPKYIQILQRIGTGKSGSDCTGCTVDNGDGLDTTDSHDSI